MAYRSPLVDSPGIDVNPEPYASLKPYAASPVQDTPELASITPPQTSPGTAAPTTTAPTANTWEIGGSVAGGVAQVAGTALAAGFTSANSDKTDAAAMKMAQEAHATNMRELGQARQLIEMKGALAKQGQDIADKESDMEIKHRKFMEAFDSRLRQAAQVKKAADSFTNKLYSNNQNFARTASLWSKT